MKRITNPTMLKIGALKHKSRQTELTPSSSQYLHDADGEDEVDSQFPFSADLQVPKPLDRNDKDANIGCDVEEPASIKQSRKIDAVSVQGAIPNRFPREALNDLCNSESKVENADDGNEGAQEDVELGPSRRRKDTNE